MHFITNAFKDQLDRSKATCSFNTTSMHYADNAHWYPGILDIPKQYKVNTRNAVVEITKVEGGRDNNRNTLG